MATWFITGCSTGLGRALAEATLTAGHQVVVTARDRATIADLEEAHPETALALTLDVTDPISSPRPYGTRRYGSAGSMC